MKTKTKNRIWFISGITVGLVVLGWGIAQKYLYPVDSGINMVAFAYVCAGGFLIFTASL